MCCCNARPVVKLVGGGAEKLPPVNTLSNMYMAKGCTCADKSNWLDFFLFILYHYYYTLLSVYSDAAGHYALCARAPINGITTILFFFVSHHFFPVFSFFFAQLFSDAHNGLGKDRFDC